MEEFLRSLMPWGASAILWVQHFSNRALDALFTAATYLGKEQFYILFLPILYWCVNKTLGKALAVAFLLSEYINGFLKDTFAITRPYDYDPRIRAPLPETSPSFPSDHAQGSLVVWGIVATEVRRRWMWAVSGVLVFLISLSRVYLGVHFPQDIIGGWILGLVVLFAYILVRRVLGRTRVRVPMPAQIVIGVLVPALLFGIHPSESSAMVAGVGCGMIVGFILESAYVGFEVAGRWWKRIARFVAGVVPLLVLYLGLKAIFPEGDVFRFVRYALVGLWAGWLAPWLFVTIGLAEGRKATRAAAARASTR